MQTSYGRQEFPAPGAPAYDQAGNPRWRKGDEPEYGIAAGMRQMGRDELEHKPAMKVFPGSRQGELSFDGQGTQPIWMTELDRRGGSSTHAPCRPAHAPTCGMDQATFLDHEIGLLANLSAATDDSPLKAVMIYELFDEPQQGRNHYPLKCATGNASTNGESCYGLVGTDWHPGPACDGYPSCNFTALGRKPAFEAVKEWAKRLAAPSSTGST